ncbi:MAG: hypothetical protein B6I20_05490 [Bacteroidetes bacterium 4572_117]|nr:MAG: hypothetical protein B6I20_05490 [Bacteroidetes bacterium 4572_117]
MAYTVNNKLQTIYIVQEYYLLAKERGITTKRIWQDVNSLYPMHISTFYNYLSINARAKLKQLGTDFNELEKKKNYVIETLQGTKNTTAKHYRGETNRVF